jgi:calcium binding protein 39
MTGKRSSTPPSPDEELPLESVTLLLQQVRQSLCGTETEHQPAPAIVSRLIDVVQFLDQLPFEARKDMTLIFNQLLRKNYGEVVDMIAEKFDPVVTRLVRGYKSPDTALSCGSMLRECIRYEKLALALFNSDLLWLFFDKYAHLTNFEVALDAISTLCDLLTHKCAAKFLEAKYGVFFRRYEMLLLSSNHVTRLRSLKLLGELLLDRANFNVMIKYVSSRHNLKVAMNALKDKSPSIQVEAFHVFKIFVANPKKPSEIVDILVKNKAKLVTFLEAFPIEKDDVQFCEERDLLVTTISALEPKEEEQGLAEADNKGGDSSSCSTSSCGDSSSFSSWAVDASLLHKL